MNRRGFLSIAAKTPLVVGPGLVLAPTLVQASLHPADIDLRRYYSFLWAEFSDLGAEMNVGMHDAWTIDRPPSVRGQVDLVRTALPSTRALRVLTAAGL